MAVNAHHRDYDKHFDQWERSRDAYDGEDAVKDRKVRYLPKLTDQSEADYDAYLKRANFYNATWRTVQGMVGMVFRVAPKEKLPAAIEEAFAEDATMTGAPLTLFVQEVTTEAVLQGRVGVLVDYPTAAPGATLADAQVLGLRPYFQLYKAEQIINWATGRIKNKTVLIRVVLEECADIEDAADEFATKEEKRWRVLELVGGVYRQRVFRRKTTQQSTAGATAQNDFEEVSSSQPLLGGAPMDYIPFVIIGTDGVGTDVEPPPLIDLVNTNLSHYRTVADLEHGAHFTGLPTAVVSGWQPQKEGEKLYVGSSAAWTFTNPEAKATYLEFKGEGLKALEARAAAKERQMAILGARMLEQQKSNVESADTQKERSKGEQSALASVAAAVSLGIQQALRWASAWAGASDAEVEYELNRDFEPAGIDAPTITALVSAWQFGALSDETLFYNFKRGEVLPPDATFEDEQTSIANSAAKLLANQQNAAAGAQPADSNAAS